MMTLSPVRAESSFPVAWGNELDALVGAADCPISETLMQDYLRTSHFYYCADEQRLEFNGFSMRARFMFSDRTFWVWSCRDSLMREWHILVGKGRSPFGVEALTRVWMHGARHDEPINPEDILVEEFPEYENANLKAH